MAQQIHYDSWGVRTTDTAPGFQSLGYAGGLEDRATGLVRFGARDYDPSVGRWTCKDPVGFVSHSYNLYSYVESNPITTHDPSGRWQWYGRWGGPEWTNGSSRWKESGHFPHLPKDPNYVPPLDPQDELYRQHDVELSMCARIKDPELRRKCRREADFDLAMKIARFQSDHPGCDPWVTWVAEFWLFFAPASPNNNEGEYVP